MLLVVASKDLTNQGIHVETSESDKLPAVTHGSKVRNEVFDVILSHFVTVPVEAGRKVI